MDRGRSPSTTIPFLELHLPPWLTQTNQYLQEPYRLYAYLVVRLVPTRSDVYGCGLFWSFEFEGRRSKYVLFKPMCVYSSLSSRGFPAKGARSTRIRTKMIGSLPLDGYLI